MLDGKYAKEQKWYWIKEQKEDEVYVIRIFDSHTEKEGRVVGAPHGSPDIGDGGDEGKCRGAMLGRLVR